MAMEYGFFNSVNGDRKKSAEFFMEFFGHIIGNGIYPNPSTNFQVMANDDMTITVMPGIAWINGTLAFDKFNYNIPIDVADGVLNRIDRVVIRLDTLGREIKIVVKKGVYASNPVAPTLQRDADAFELGLADIYIGNGVVAINQGNITDLRLSSELCGIVHGVVDQVDVTTLYNQYTQGFELKRDEFEQEFMLWFQTLQDVLDENTAANLLNMINANTNSIGVVDQKVDAHLADYTAHGDVINTYRSGKDANGVFVTLEYKRLDGTLAKKSVLSGGTSPKYATRTVTYYGTNGTTVLLTKAYALTYTVDDLTSEVAT